jgi:hypothetical protein
MIDLRVLGFVRFEGFQMMSVAQNVFNMHIAMGRDRKLEKRGRNRQRFLRSLLTAQPISAKASAVVLRTPEIKLRAESVAKGTYSAVQNVTDCSKTR